MKNLKITDPLILEEQVLDLTFNIRMLKKEVAVIKKTKGKDMFFRKKKLENETKTAAEKLKELEVKVNLNKNRDAESITMFAQNWKTGGLETAADIEAELEQLTKQKEELTIDYHERQQGYKTSLFTLDQRYNDIIKQSEDVRIRRELKRVTLDRVKAQLQNERDLEAKLDAELEKILGRAVTMADLELLY
jgi:chromosome segregation ATPase